MLGIAAALWLSGAAGGLGYLASYASSTRAQTPAPATWPPDSQIARADEAVSVVVFLHPHCPCSSSTLAELGRILARSPRGCRVTIAFNSPTSQARDWGRTSLRERAETLAGVEVIDDVDAREARLFRAADSGHVVVYGPDGRLRFAGGITASRGHEGDNLGQACVLAALNGETPIAETTKTFGCEIDSPVPNQPCPRCAQETSP
jgi:hypothetical protein